MAQPLLALQHRSGAAPQVYRVPGASPTPFGDPIGVAIEGATSDNSLLVNRVIQFQGDVYAAVNGGVYKKADPTSETGAWNLDHAFPNFTLFSQREMCIFGPYQFTENGVEKLFVCWLSDVATNAWNASILDGGTGMWSEAGDQIAGTSIALSESIGQQIVYRGVLYVFYQAGNTVLTFDPIAQSFGSLAIVDFDLAEGAGVCVFNDRLLVLARGAMSGNATLFEISGTISPLFEIAPAIPFSTSPELKNLLVPSPNGSVLYGIAVNSGGGSSFLKFIDTGGTISFDSDLTNTVLPLARRPGQGDSGATTRWWAMYDQETTPGTAALQIFFAVDGNAGTPVTQYDFVDEATELNLNDVGGVAAWAFSSVTTGGGERIFTPGELHIEIVERLAILGGEAIRFKAWGDVGADKFVDFRLNTETEVPLTQATLTGTPTVVSGVAPAPTRNVNTLEGVTADGTTIYQTVWDIATDGLVAGQRAQLVPRIYV